MQVSRTHPIRPDMGVLDVKLKRAKKHTDDLKIAISAFQKEHGEFIGRKIDMDGNHVIYVKYVPEVLIMISAIMGDVLQNLRSTLDHLAYRIVISNPLTTSRKNIFFPCGESEKNTWRPTVVG